MSGSLPVAEIHWRSLWPLLLTSLALMGSPGPATMSLLAAGAAYGARRSVPYMIGVSLGTMIVLVAVATGITAALLARPAFGVALTWISAAYILWLAYHIATAPPLSQHTAVSAPPTLLGGAVLGVANPKAWVAIAAVFASAYLADDALVDATAKIAALAAMIVAICATWLVAGPWLAGLFREPRRARLTNAALAVALVGAMALAVLH